MSSSCRQSGAVDAALQWARDEYAVEYAEILDRVPLEGGVSGATVERITVRVGATGSELAQAPVALVVKHTSRREIDALTSWRTCTSRRSRGCLLRVETPSRTGW